MVVELRHQLSNGYAEIWRQTTESVALAIAEQKAEISQLEADRQHFVQSLAESMNKVTKLRNRYNDFSEADPDEQEWGEDYNEDELHQWYGAAGVGDMDYTERVKKVVAPLTGVGTQLVDLCGLRFCCKKGGSGRRDCRC